MKRRQRKHPFFDMHYLWNPILVLLSSGVIYKAKSWNIELDEDNQREIMSLREVNENGVINNRNHSLIQQIKIPLHDEPTVPNIIKIALYSGIYQGYVEGDGKNFSPEYPIKSIYDVIEKADVNRLSIRIGTSGVLEKVQNYLDIYKNPPKNFTRKASN